MVHFIRLPLIFVENVIYNEFEKKYERVTVLKFWKYDNSTVIIIELPKGDYEVAHCEFTQQFLSTFSISTLQCLVYAYILLY